MSRKLYVTDDMGLDDRLVEIAQKSPEVAMLWPWLIPYFDDWGRAEASPNRIKGKVFPLFDHITPATITNALAIFEAHGLIILYSGADGKRYMAIPAEKWFRYQTHIRASKREEDKSRCPAPPQEKPGSVKASPRSDSGTPRQTLEESVQSRDSAHLRDNARDCGENRASPSLSPSPSPSLSPPPPPSASASAREDGGGDGDFEKQEEGKEILPPEDLSEPWNLTPDELLTRFRAAYPEREPELAAALACAKKSVHSQPAYLRPFILRMLSGKSPPPIEASGKPLTDSGGMNSFALPLERQTVPVEQSPYKAL